MSFYGSILRPLAFKVDPESVHETAMAAIQRGLLKTDVFEHPLLRQEFFGTVFPNPLGLAAGFDKNAAALEQWHKLGFGFVEAGTTTFHAQPGNPKPRMFRLPEDGAIINRLGFNNIGARAFATKLAESKSQIPVGVNIGKSKVTPIEEASDDYAESFRLIHTFGAYVAINVSSPNTPGLRSMQTRETLFELITKLRAIDPVKPLLVKVAPDLAIEELEEVIAVCLETKIAGMIATNTTLSREGLLQDPHQDGGLSGRPLKQKSDAMLKRIAQAVPKDFILMGVGGISHGDDLYDKIALGAHLCQVYTGWIYGGPNMPPNSLRRLIERMESEGIKNLGELRGSAL